MLCARRAPFPRRHRRPCGVPAGARACARGEGRGTAPPKESSCAMRVLNGRSMLMFLCWYSPCSSTITRPRHGLRGRTAHCELTRVTERASHRVDAGHGPVTRAAEQSPECASGPPSASDSPAGCGEAGAAHSAAPAASAAASFQEAGSTRIPARELPTLLAKRTCRHRETCAICGNLKPSRVLHCAAAGTAGTTGASTGTATDTDSASWRQLTERLARMRTHGCGGFDEGDLGHGGLGLLVHWLVRGH